MRLEVSERHSENELSSAPGTEQLFMGRQPILDLQRHIVGYELLFRSGNCNSAGVTDFSQASFDVISTALSGFGFNELLGRFKGFFNVSRVVLLSDVVCLLPRDQVVIELLETVHIDDIVIARCSELKEHGYTIALDDHVYDASLEELYAVVDIIKIDILAVADTDLPEMITIFRKWPLTLLAEKVETIAQHERCVELGFDLFQGYYFARPIVLERRHLDISKISVMKLLKRILADADVKEIEEIFKQSPTMTYNLLRLVNSVAFGLREKISSLRHALMLLGQLQLKRWAMLAMFASQDSGGSLNPLLELATQRGRLMELLVLQRPVGNSEKDLHESAFITGILSVLDVLFNAPMEEIIEHLHLNAAISGALLDKEGLLGTLLCLVEKVERVEPEGVMPLLEPLGLDMARLLDAQMESIQWSNSVLSPT